jgi:hypothetical protein
MVMVVAMVEEEGETRLSMAGTMKMIILTMTGGGGGDTGVDGTMSGNTMGSTVFGGLLTNIGFSNVLRSTNKCVCLKSCGANILFFFPPLLFRARG